MTVGAFGQLDSELQPREHRASCSVASDALTEWRRSRAKRLDELFEAHRRVGGSGAGRRTETEQINWALVLRLAGEYQGFVRDLHDEAVATFSVWAARGNSDLERTLRTLLTLGRKLDRGNARPEAIGEDFGRFGIGWWPALRTRDKRTEKRQSQLEQLNRARNAIAHARLDELTVLRNEGSPITLATIRVWRDSLNGLAVTMDGVLAERLGVLFGRPTPW